MYPSAEHVYTRQKTLEEVETFLVEEIARSATGSTISALGRILAFVRDMRVKAIGGHRAVTEAKVALERIEGFLAVELSRIETMLIDPNRNKADVDYLRARRLALEDVRQFVHGIKGIS